MTQPPANPDPQPDPPLEPLTRMQVLAAMGVTAVVLLLISKVWLYFDSAGLLPLRLS
ncbi:CPBP family intramembrane metalloprotease, partial [filamentous cyanobacterium CCP4]